MHFHDLDEPIPGRPDGSAAGRTVFVSLFQFPAALAAEFGSRFLRPAPSLLLFSPAFFLIQPFFLPSRLVKKLSVVSLPLKTLSLPLLFLQPFFFQLLFSFFFPLFSLQSLFFPFFLFQPAQLLFFLILFFQSLPLFLHALCFLPGRFLDSGFLLVPVVLLNNVQFLDGFHIQNRCHGGIVPASLGGQSGQILV